MKKPIACIIFFIQFFLGYIYAEERTNPYKQFNLNDFEQLYPTTFISIDSNTTVQLVMNDTIIELKNSPYDDNGICFSLILQTKKWYIVAAWKVIDASTLFVGIGKILSSTPIRIFSRAYDAEVNPLKLYKEPSYASQYISEFNYHAEELKVIGFSKKWLYIEIVINNKIHRGWISPDMQCANIYSTCS